MGLPRRDQAAGGLDAVEDRHADVHHDDVGPGALDGLDGGRTVGGLGHDGHVRLLVDQEPDAGADHLLVVDECDADHAGLRWRRTGGVGAVVGPVAAGTQATTDQPPVSTGP